MSVGAPTVGNTTWDGFQSACFDWVLGGSGLTDQEIMWAGQSGPRPAEPAITVRVSNIAEIGRTMQRTEDNPLSFTLNVSSVDFGANTLTSVAHGRATGDGPARISSTGTLPAPLQPNTDYWIVAPNGNTLQLSDSYLHTGGGQGAGNPITVIDLLDAGSGTITLNSTSSSLIAGKELVETSSGYKRVTLELHAHSADGVGLLSAVALLERVKLRRELTSQQEILWGANLGLIGVEHVRAIQGTRDDMLFEPRAYLDVHLCVPMEESEYARFIEQVEITDLSTNQVTTVSRG